MMKSQEISLVSYLLMNGYRYDDLEIRENNDKKRVFAIYNDVERYNNILNKYKTDKDVHLWVNNYQINIINKIKEIKKNYKDYLVEDSKDGIFSTNKINYLQCNNVQPKSWNVIIEEEKINVFAFFNKDTNFYKIYMDYIKDDKYFSFRNSYKQIREKFFELSSYKK